MVPSCKAGASESILKWARKEFRNELLFSLLKEIPKINVIFEGFLTE